VYSSPEAPRSGLEDTPEEQLAKNRALRAHRLAEAPGRNAGPEAGLALRECAKASAAPAVVVAAVVVRRQP
jgi:hypothetical protein